MGMKLSLFNSLIYNQLTNLVSSFKFFNTNLNSCDNTCGYYFLKIYIHLTKIYSVFYFYFFPSICYYHSFFYFFISPFVIIIVVFFIFCFAFCTYP
jgi:hypothetical protein